MFAEFSDRGGAMPATDADAARACGASGAPQRNEVCGVFPLSLVQESLWFSEQITPGNPVYNLPDAWRLRGPLQTDVLQQALNELVRRHEALRTVFSAGEGKPAQIVVVPKALALVCKEMAGGPGVIPNEGGAGTEAVSAAWMKAEARHVFNLRQGPLVRATLFRVAPDDHVLLVNMHHVISDACSQNILMDDLAELYSAITDRRSPRLPDLPVQYADFAAWQRELVRGELREAQIDYWKKQLQRSPGSLDLQADFSRPAHQSFEGSTLFFTLPAELVAGLKEFSRAQGVTWFMTALAAFNVLLYRHTRQEDITVGSPISGRQRQEVERLIGFFVNTHALRTDMRGDPDFLQLVHRVRNVTLGALRNQDVTFDQVVAAVQPRRDLCRNPLFQVVFGLQPAGRDAFQMGSLAAARLEVENGTAKFDWSLLLTEKADGSVRVRSEYSTRLFLRETVERFQSHFVRLLAEILDDPARRISDLPLLTASERRQVLVDWNRTSVPYERDECVHRIFERYAAAFPERPAVVCGDCQISYGDLNLAANRVAAGLRQYGVGPEVLAGICMDRSLDLLAALLGVLKAGGAYLPLDPSYPRERISFMVRDAKVRLVISDGKADLQGLTPEGVPVLALQDLKAAGSRDGARNPDSGAAGEHLAYVMYTSGSTGQPKGVAVTHRGILRLVRNPTYVRLGAGEVLLQFAPISFDASTFEIWGALLNGARLAVMPPGLLSLEQLAAEIERQNVTTLWLTAGLFHQLVDEQIESLAGVRQLLAGGETLSVPHVAKALARLKNTQLINGYGPTENTTFSCCFPVPQDWHGARSVPIGRPIGNTRVYVLDGRLNPVPVGIPGELFVAGDGVARGYMNQPQLTMEKFVNLPEWAEWERSPVYRTGDLVRWLADGNLEFLGRLDDQVKIRGHRVEPGEAANVLARCPGVERVLVVPRPDPAGGLCLAAYFIRSRDDSSAPYASTLREFAWARLPRFMVPAHFVELEQLPLTENGKVDYRSLPAPEAAGALPGEGVVAPRNPVEGTVLQIWEEVLGRRGFGVHQNFFHLGGHSLLATQVVSRLSRAFQHEVPVVALFERPTVAALAEWLAGKPRGEPAAAIPRRMQPGQAQALLARLGELSEAEMDELLQDPDLKKSVA
jgi:amino acid adenylation domain-containing protein